MPIHLPPLSRRRFLAGSLASAGTLVLRPAWAADEKSDPHRLALLSDVHIAEKPDTLEKNTWNMTDHFKQVVGEVAGLSVKPGGVLINGDLAYHFGLAGDYGSFRHLLEPIRVLGLPLYLALGNHDRHEAFSAAFAERQALESPVSGKYVVVVEMERANLFLLDSLLDHGPQANNLVGKFGPEQLHWLAAALDKRPDKPAIVFGHHNLQDKPEKNGKFTGLLDTGDFWAVLRDRRQVKAYVFGHTHTWRLAERDGIHVVNLPAVAYLFAKDAFLGWVDARLETGGIKLTPHVLDPKHPENGKTTELKWRNA